MGRRAGKSEIGDGRGPTRSATRTARSQAAFADTNVDNLTGHEEWRGLRVTGGIVSARAFEYLVEISESMFRSVAFTAAPFAHTRLTDTIFEDCELSGANFGDSSLIRVEFRRCRASGLQFSTAQITDVLFDDCKLDDANFRMSKLERVTFSATALRTADFSNAKGTDIAMFDSQLDECDFTKSQLVRLALNGSKLDSIRSASALRGATIDTDQQIAFAMKLLAESAIHVSNERGPA